MAKITLFSLLFLSVYSNCYSQFYEDTVIQISKNPIYNSEFDIIGKETKVDTLLFTHESWRNILVGTTVLPNTHNNMSLMTAGLYLKSVKGSECMSHDEDKMTESIANYTIKDSLLIVETMITDNCMYDFLCEARYLEETENLELLFTGYGQGYAACYCCFGLVYTFYINDFEAFEKLKSIQISDLENTKINIHY